MKRRQKKKSRRKPLAVILVLAFFALLFGPQLKTVWEMKKEIKSLQAQKSELLKRKAELTKLERDLQTDEMIEKMAREQLGMVKPDEKVIVKVVPQQSSTP